MGAVVVGGVEVKEEVDDSDAGVGGVVEVREDVDKAVGADGVVFEVREDIDEVGAVVGGVEAREDFDEVGTGGGGEVEVREYGDEMGAVVVVEVVEIKNGGGETVAGAVVGGTGVSENIDEVGAGGAIEII
ncbi:hypothetical protein AGMMS49531_11550 [Endomicrobiia bacterium]|nr:hypothetical protein AGMMS49531_11550 [Endomicrobiia bacterium]